MAAPATTNILVTVNDRPWTVVSSFRNAGPDASVFVLNTQDGSVSFGDGVNGAIPPVGSTITASYRLGSGASGNISRKILEIADVTKFWIIVHDRAQILGWGDRPNIRRVKRRH